MEHTEIINGNCGKGNIKHGVGDGKPREDERGGNARRQQHARTTSKSKAFVAGPKIAVGVSIISGGGGGCLWPKSYTAR